MVMHNLGNFKTPNFRSSFFNRAEQKALSCLVLFHLYEKGKQV